MEIKVNYMNKTDIENLLKQAENFGTRVKERMNTLIEQYNNEEENTDMGYYDTDLPEDSLWGAWTYGNAAEILHRDKNKLKAKDALRQVMELSDFRGDPKDYAGFIEYVKHDNEIAAKHMEFFYRVTEAVDYLQPVYDEAFAAL